jgi:hypothetical protein
MAYTTNISWLPLADSDIIPLAALSSCHINLNDSCDLSSQQISISYAEAWRHPVPEHLRTRGKGGHTGSGPMNILTGRLGVVYNKS